MAPTPARSHLRAPPYTVAEEIVHTVTHGVGLVLSAAGFVVLIVAASLRGNAWHVVGCAVFGTTLVLLYAASTLYHGVQSPRVCRIRSCTANHGAARAHSWNHGPICLPIGRSR